MNDNQREFEIKHFQRIRDEFRKSSNELGDEILLKIIKRHISDRKYEEIVERIRYSYDFTRKSIFMEEIKLDWWKEYLSGNMHKTQEGKVTLIDFEGKLKEFNSIEQVYQQFINENNQSIWKPYEKIFTKILTEWVVEYVIEACKGLSVKERLDFIKQSLFIIEKHQAIEEYTKYELNEQLRYYKTILELSLSEPGINKFVSEDGKLFSSIVENDKIKILKEYLHEEKFDDFFTLVKTVYASVPYQLYSKHEAAFHNIFHVLAHLICSKSKSEESTNTGRIDTVIELGHKAFLFEFKLNSAAKAIKQIKEMKYYEKYLGNVKDIFLIGVSFALKTKNINDWKVERLESG